jgi:hypothetical protein
VLVSVFFQFDWGEQNQERAITVKNGVIDMQKHKTKAIFCVLLLMLPSVAVVFSRTRKREQQKMYKFIGLNYIYKLFPLLLIAE